MSDEPEYLQRLRRSQEQKQQKRGAAAGAGPAQPMSAQEQEATRWARELAKGTDLRSIRALSGARFAALIRIQGPAGSSSCRWKDSPTGRPWSTGSSRAPPLVRKCSASTRFGGRPVTVATDESGQMSLKMGAPRPGANPISPEKMIRRAEAAAVERERPDPRGQRPGRSTLTMRRARMLDVRQPDTEYGMLSTAAPPRMIRRERPFVVRSTWCSVRVPPENSSSADRG